MKKTWWIWLLLVVFFIFPAISKIFQLSIDYLWFKELHYEKMFTTILSTKALFGIISGALAGLFLSLNFFLAVKLSSGKVFISPDLSQYALMMKAFKSISKTVQILSIILAIFIGLWGAEHWEEYLRFKGAVAFGSNDPLFNKDISFHVLKLPFLQFLYSFSMVVLVLSLIGTFALYFIRGGVYIGSMKFSILPKTRAHLLLLIAAIVGLLYFHFQLKAFALITDGGQIVTGAGYADIHFYLPVLMLLKYAAVMVSLFIIVTIWLRTYIPALIAIAVLILFAFTGAIGTQFLQKFIVGPNELSRENPYIKWSIAYTRAAYNLDKIDETVFSPNDSLTGDVLAENSATIKNIRLWDHAPLKRTYSQLQEIRTYYEFLDVDNDRYVIDGESRQVMLSPRELVPASLPSRIWINEHLSYTHGYGLCMGPVNQVTNEGLPEFFIKNIPPVSTSTIDVTRPEIYFGEAEAGYAIVNTKAKEFDYPSGDQNVYSEYSGTGGIKMGNLLKRLLFVAAFKEIKILLSTDINSNSKILLNRQIMSRVRKVAPFFRFDSDPYMVITDKGRLVWIIDGYTTTNKYPYSYQMTMGNYIRNSVKAVVDAYNGSVDFYLSDESDPIVKTYKNMFPGLLKPLSEMPKDIRSHLRYPQSIFAIQAQAYAEFHMTDPQVFYNKEDLWKIPGGIVSNDSSTTMAPYYTIMKLAGVGEKEEFILMVPFTPAKKDNMIAWMAARCDEPNYGKLIVFNFPKQKLVYGPRQIDSRISQDAEISQQLTLWNQGGSRVIRGSLLVIPVAQSLLCVQPLYIEAQGGGLPELKRVIVNFGNAIAMEENLELSIEKIFGNRKSSDSPSVTQGQSTPTVLTSTVKELITEAQRQFQEGARALGRGDWAAYGNSVRRVQELLNQMGSQLDKKK